MAFNTSGFGFALRSYIRWISNMNLILSPGFYSQNWIFNCLQSGKWIPNWLLVSSRRTKFKRWQNKFI